ncbi:MAG: glycosyltransferase [Lachnospiraceae bacterium]|nr:glycosyltransferase [Lachnospiraceae bacterium]
MIDEPKVSVIVPVYNVARYLPECIESVLFQSLKDIEVICVNDGSTDGSGELLDKYAAQDNRVSVIHKKNEGYGRAMNIGMGRAKGRYISIVESDDKILPDFLETLYRSAEENELDIIKSELYFWLPTRSYSYRYHGDSRDRYFGQVLPRERLWLRCQFLMNTWSGLYRRGFIESNCICHHESPGASFQDNGFWMQGMIFAERVMVLNYAGYMYRQDNESASIKDKAKVYTMSDEYEWLANHLKGKVSSREMDVINSYRLIRGYRNLYRIDDKYKREYCNRLISDYEQYGDVFFNDVGWQDNYCELTSDTDSFCDRIIDRKRKVTTTLAGAASLIIYGAGKRGERLFRLLCFHGWGGKMQCFIETGMPEKHTIGDVSVYQMDDKRVNYEDALVIISAESGGKMANEMRQALSDRSITRLMIGEDLIDNYYMIC